jgi:hypothetical protein
MLLFFRPARKPATAQAPAPSTPTEPARTSSR